MWKGRAFKPLGAAVGLTMTEMKSLPPKKNSFVYSLIHFQATLQPTESFIHFSKLFISIFL